MPEKLKKAQEQPAEEQKRTFGEDTMHLVGKMEPLGWEKSRYKKGLDVMEVWESRRKCSCEGIGLTSAVRVDVFLHAGIVDKFIVSEVREGKLWESDFNPNLEPAAGGTAPASLVEEQRGKLGEFMKGEFFRHAIDSKEKLTITRIQDLGSGSRFMYLSKKTISQMHLKYRDCGRWDQEGESLVWTRLKETAIPVKIQEGTTAFFVIIPEDMLFIAGLKLGDYVEVGREGSLLSLRKTEGAGQNARKLGKKGSISSSIAVNIPKAMAEELKVEKGMYGIWTFDEDEEGKLKLWLELSKKNPHIATINQHKTEGGYSDSFQVYISNDMGGWLKKGDEVVLEVKDGKLYVEKNKPQG